VRGDRCSDTGSLQRAPENTPDASPASPPEGFLTWLVHPKAFQPSHATRRPRDPTDPPEGFSIWPIRPKTFRPGWSTRRLSNLATLPEGFVTWPIHPKAFRPGRSTRGFHDLAGPPEGFPTWLVHPKAFQPSRSTRRLFGLADPPEGFSTRPIHPRVSRPAPIQIRRPITVQLHTQFFRWEEQVQNNGWPTFLVDNLWITLWYLVSIVLFVQSAEMTVILTLCRTAL